MKNKVNLILSNTYLSAFYGALDDIKQKVEKDKFGNIILVVPDKFSLNAEQIVFDRLKCDTIFNVWLTTLSRLTAEVLKNDLENCKILSKSSGTMLVGEIIAKNRDKITAYKKVANDYSLAETMFNAINLLKSSGITPAEIKANIKEDNFGDKLKDIFVIYDAYEKQLKTDKIDATTKLEMFDKKIKDCSLINNSHIYFAMFDSFTNAQISSLVQLGKFAKSLTISLCANTTQNNKMIYDNVVFQRVKQAFESQFICPEIKNVYFNGSKRQNFLLNNYFSTTDVSKFETNDVEVVKCDDTTQEIRLVASKIKALAMENKFQFKDMAVAVNGLEDYALQIKTIFDEYNLPYYIDVSKTMGEHYFCKFLSNVFDFVLGRNTLFDAISIVKNPIVNFDFAKKETFENFCIKFNVMGEEFYNPFNFDNSEECRVAEKVRNGVFGAIKTFSDELAKATAVDEKLDAIMNFLMNVDAKNSVGDIAQKQLDSVDKSIDEQIYGKFIEIVSEAREMLGADELENLVVFDIFKSIFKSTQISTIPLKCESVFVGDASSSTFLPSKVLFVMGATADRMPNFSVDSGTITDAEIERFESVKKITPTIKELNKREKFKLFNLMLNGSEKLEVSYSILTNGTPSKPSDFVVKLCDILYQNGKKLEIREYNSLFLDAFEGNYKLPTMLVGTMKNAIKISKSNSPKNAVVKQMMKNELAEIVSQKQSELTETDQRYGLHGSEKVLFPNGYTKISQIENYFQCPFKQFVNYGIRPQEQQKYELQKKDIGTILHKIAELYVLELMQNNFAQLNTEKCVEKYFDKIFSDKKYSNLKSMNFEVSSLRREAVRFLNAINHQIENSDYKPKYTEYAFFGIKLESGLLVNGVVDRIDVCKDNGMFRVIDYKTGADKFNYKKVFYGIKTQLIVYIDMLEKTFKNTAVAGMYMPVKNTFGSLDDEEGILNYKLDGVFLKDDSVVFRMDKNLIEQNESDIINVKKKKDGSFNSTTEKFALSSEEFGKLKLYCVRLIDQAVDEMLEGYVVPKPYKIQQQTSCDFCQFKSMCHFSAKQNGFREIKPKDKNSF